MNDLRDPGALRRELREWLSERVEQAGVRGLLFGLSGGIDSAVVCGLAAEAVGAERCLALMLPIESAEEDLRHARAVADAFGVSALQVGLDGPFHALLDTLSGHREAAERVGAGTGDAGADTSPAAGADASALARMNLKPRLRMVTLYYFSNLLGYLVVGTGNRAELTVGYFTKHGDGGADLFPLGDLLKGEVRALARELGVPAEVIERAPSAGLHPGQTDEGELGITYDQLDGFLLAGSTGDPDADEEVRRRHAASRHKVEPAPIPRPQ